MRAAQYVLLAGVASATAVGGANAQAETLVLSSSDKPLMITLSIGDEQPRFAATHRGKALLKPSPLGLVTDNGGTLSAGLTLKAARTASVDQTYDLMVGKTRKVRERDNETGCA